MNPAARRGVAAFALGFAAGALTLLFVLWRTGGLVPGSWLARRTPDLTAPRRQELPPLPTIPFPTPAASSASAIPPPPTPVLSVSPVGITPAAALTDFTLGQEPIRMPVEGAGPTSFKDDFADMRGTNRRHEAVDIMAPRGTPVLAAVDGRVVKLFTSAQGGLTVYEFDRDSTYAYYYAHLDRYAENLKEGEELHRGDRIGYVGTTGNAPRDRPHLHFAIFRLGPEKRWWQGIAIDPYPLLLRAR